MALVTLTTDFGSHDWFVGTMKAVILGLSPKALFVDITHEIPPGNIRAGAFALAASCRFAPKGSIHVAVVDPGVGSSRKAIAVQTADYFFIGPDNGVLSWALANQNVKAIHALENHGYFLDSISQTFHGRDIFAPVAAHVSQGTPIQKLGPKQKSFVKLPWPEPVIRKEMILGEILYLDHFGNAITNIDAATLETLGDADYQVFLGGKRLCAVGCFYQAVALGKPVGVLGSVGFLEIAVNGGSAAQKLKLRTGTVVTVRGAKKPRQTKSGIPSYSSPS